MDLSLQQLQTNVAEVIDEKADRERYQNATIGHPDGSVYVTDRPGYIWARVGGSSGQIIQVYARGILPQRNKPIVIHRLAHRPRDWGIVDLDLDAYPSNGTGETVSGYTGQAGVEVHGGQHYLTGGDPVLIHLRQWTPLRVYGNDGFVVHVMQGVLPRSGVDAEVRSQAVDVTGDVPTSAGARYDLISVDSSGILSVTQGTIVSGVLSLGLDDVPATPAGHFRLAAIRLYYGQTKITEGTNTDIIDLRWPQETIAGTLPVASIAPGTAQYQFLTTGATPFTPAWSTGFLNITATKTLTVSNSLTLAGTDSTALTLTTALTNQGAAGILNWSGAYTLTIANTASVSGTNTGDVVLASPNHGLGLTGQTITLGTPSSLTVSTTNAVTTTTHTHAITSSANPGAAAALLASDGSGNLRLIGLGIGVAAISGSVNLTGFNVADNTNGLYQDSVPMLLNYLPTGADGLNTFIAGSGNTTLSPGGGASYLASYNLAIGRFAGKSITTGNSNVTIGYRAHELLTTGAANTAIGYLSQGLGAVTGSHNLSLGYLSLARLVGGTDNVAIGDYALQNVTSGVGNFGFGYETLNAVSTTNYNVGIGDSALHTTTGATNVAIGAYSGYSTTGGSGVFIGFEAGFYETAGNKLFIDNAPRASESDGRAKALIYGVFNATVANQRLTVNALSGIQTSMVGSGVTYQAFNVNGSQLFVGADSSQESPIFQVVPSYVVNTHASYTTRTVFSQWDVGGAREALRFETGSSAAMIGFLGANAIARYSSTGDLRQALIDFGLVTTGGASPLDLNGGRLTGFVSSLASTTASASIKIPAGTAPTSPVDGDLWNDSTQKTVMHYTNGLKKSIVGTIFTQTADVTVANTVTETTLVGTGVGTATLPANYFVVGKTIRIRAFGYFSTTGNPNITFKLKYGSTVLIDSGAFAAGTNVSNHLAHLEARITCRTTGATGTVYSQGEGELFAAHGTNGSFDMETTAPVTIDTTASSTLSITATWGTADAGNTITITNLGIEVLN